MWWVYILIALAFLAGVLSMKNYCDEVRELYYSQSRRYETLIRSLRDKIDEYDDIINDFRGGKKRW